MNKDKEREKQRNIMRAAKAYWEQTRIEHREALADWETLYNKLAEIDVRDTTHELEEAKARWNQSWEEEGKALMEWHIQSVKLKNFSNRKGAKP
tara:strand:+ start:167 stop:448 length:282 start_codon:yes stop_codon:yes gene_type:complete